MYIYDDQPSQNGDEHEMKRALSLVFTAALIFSMSLAIYAGSANAFSSSVQPVYSAIVTPSIDGKWTSNEEWDDAATSYLVSAAGVRYGAFRDKYLVDFSTGALSVKDNYIIELFTDKTNDAGDYVRIAYCTDLIGSTSPQPTDFMIEYSGHGTVMTYVGNGIGWTASGIGVTPSIAQLVSATKLNGTNPHYTTEVQFEKTTTVPNAAQNNYICVAVYDASNPATGIVTWPPNGDINVPNTYGFNDASAPSTMPEGLDFSVVAMVSLTAVVIGCLYLKKQPKTFWIH